MTKFPSIDRSLILKLSIVIAISIFALFIRIHSYIQQGKLIGDEAVQYSIGKLSFYPVWRNDKTFDDVTSFPGHYLFLWPFINSYDANNFALRTPTIVMQILFFFILYFASKPLFKTCWGYFIVYAIVCFNENLLIHSLELRPYSSLPTLSLLSLYYSDILIRQKTKLNNFQKVLAIFLYIFICLFNAYGIFIILLPMIYHFLTTKNWRTQDFKSYDYRFLITLLAISCAIWGWYMLGFFLGTYGEKKTFVRTMETFLFVPNPFHNLIDFLRTILGNLMGFKPFHFLFAGFLCSLFISRKESIQQMIFLIILIILPVSLTCLASWKAHYIFVPRHFSWAIPYFAILIAWQWDSFIYHFTNKKSSIP